uniref:Single-stranded DNA-binding protein-like n=2 Tax=Nicotiana TaxID=4085 RepID=A0A1S4BSY3_TOBAC
IGAKGCGGSGGGGTAKGSSGGSGGCGMMKAPGGGGAYISRPGFESNPKGYFSGLHTGEKGGK